MKFGRKNRRESKSDSLPVQTVPKDRQTGFELFQRYETGSKAERELYSSLREAVPIIDAAIEKTIRLIGNFKVVTEDKSAQKPLNRFLESVLTTGGNYGIYPFITTYLDEMLTYGQAVGEIVLTNDNSDIAALYNANFNDVEITNDGNPLNLIVCKKENGLTPAPYQNLIMATLLNPEPNNVRGKSVLQGLPFVSSILIKIFNAIGNNWDRVGNVRYAVTYRPE